MRYISGWLMEPSPEAGWVLLLRPPQRAVGPLPGDLLSSLCLLYDLS